MKQLLYLVIGVAAPRQPFRIAEDGPDAATVVERARDLGVLVFAFGPRTVRAVTHLDVTLAQCERAGDVLLTAIDAGRR